MIFLWWNWML